MSIQISEFVGIGHPDKMADIIADSLLEIVLQKNLKARLACEVLLSKNMVVVAGELSDCIDAENLIKDILVKREIWNENLKIISDLKEQSSDISSYSIDSNKGIVSGDQSVAIGYATQETSNYMPLSFVVVREIIKSIEKSIYSGEIVGAKFDSKVLVVLEDKKITNLFISIHHSPNIEIQKFRDSILKYGVEPVIQKYNLSADHKNIFINLGQFTIGGLDADTGVANRKIVVDSYGPSIRHGGGGYSGKDLTKVDRLSAYYARWICKNFVAAGVCKFLELQITFSYGSKIPTCFSVNKLDSKYSESEIISSIEKIFPIDFSEIYKLFNQPNIPYGDLAAGGHFGRDDLLNLPWESLDKVSEIQKYYAY